MPAPPRDSALESEAVEWVRRTWDPRMTVREWWAALADSGWGFPHWPREWFGRGLAPTATAAVRRILSSAGALGPPAGSGPVLAAPVILAMGSEEQKQRWMRPLADGTENWCQFFSEPGAGSDLAALGTRAVHDGAGWVVNGQKVWNSGTIIADRGILLARTDPDVAKHRGISFFVIDMDQPGLDIRPIRQINGRSEFNETFFTDARVGDEGLIGQPGDGWRAAMLTLGNERETYAGGGDHGLVTVLSGEKGGNLDRPAGEARSQALAEKINEANIPPVHEPGQLIDLARRFGRSGDPLIRQRIAGIYALSESLRLTGERAAAARSAGRPPGPESSVGYVGGVRLLRLIRDLTAELAGPAATLWDPRTPESYEAAMTVLTVPCHGIQGGAEQIQLNILGERVLGLPKEPQVDRDLPFSRLPRS